jgi:hypothetical protein
MDLSMNHISDALQVPLSRIKTKIEGEAHFNIPLALPGLLLPLNIKAVGSINNEQLGVLFLIKGDLYILVAHNPTTTPGAVSAFLIDAKQVTIDGKPVSPEQVLTPKMNLRKAVKAFGKGVVRSFYAQPGGSWEVLKVPA